MRSDGGPPDPERRRAVVYARVSREGGEQDERSQLQLLATWAAARGWQMVATHWDRVSGDPARRAGDPPGLRRALQLIQDRKADVLVVFAADRLVRSPLGLLQLVARVQQLGGHVASYQDGADLDTTTDLGELYLFLRGWWARMELKLIRARTMAGLARARAAGRRPGPATRPVAGVLAGRVLGMSWAELGRAAGVSASTARRRHQDALAAASAPGPLKR